MVNPLGVLDDPSQRDEFSIKDVKDLAASASKCGCDSHSCSGVGCNLKKPISELNKKLQNLGDVSEFESLDHLSEKHWQVLYDAFRIQTRSSPFIGYTGAVCPAPCQSACTESLREGESGIVDIEDLGELVSVSQDEQSEEAGRGNADSVKIKKVEDRLFKLGRDSEKVVPERFDGLKKNWFDDVFEFPNNANSKNVVIVGSGPAGMEAAFRLRQKGCSVTIYEKDDRPGGLFAKGIPDHKFPHEMNDFYFEKIKKMGVVVETETEVAAGQHGAIFLGKKGEESKVISKPNALILATGVTDNPRELKIDGVGAVDREGGGIVQAMDLLREGNDDVYQDKENDNYKGKTAIVIGGGDTAQDAKRTLMKNGAKVVSLVRKGDKREVRPSGNSYPQMSLAKTPENKLMDWEFEFTKGEQHYLVHPHEVISEDGKVVGLKVRYDNQHPDKAGDIEEIKCDMIVTALGFLGPKKGGLADRLGGQKGVYLAGDVKGDQDWIIVGAQKSAEDVVEKVSKDLGLDGKTVGRAGLRRWGAQTSSAAVMM